MGDILTDSLGEERIGGEGTRREDERVFECPLCGARRVGTAIRYDQLGYAVCPVCSHADGP